MMLKADAFHVVYAWRFLVSCFIVEGRVEGGRWKEGGREAEGGRTSSYRIASPRSHVSLHLVTCSNDGTNLTDVSSTMECCILHVCHRYVLSLKP